MTVVGNDLLPNCYVKKINLHDNKIEVKAFCVDSNTEPEWCNDPVKMKYYKLVVVSTQSEAVILSMREGILKMNKRHIQKLDANAVVKVVSMKHIKSEVVDGNKIYQITTSHPYENTNNLFVYAAVVVDPIEIAGERFADVEFIQGPIASEIVFENGIMQTTTSIWKLPSNEQWIGPVHRHPEAGFMQFSRHSDNIPHQPVSRVYVPNLKLKDLRKKTKRKNSIKKFSNKLTEVSDLFHSFGDDGANKFMFFVNMEQIIYKNTKYGTVFLALDDSYSDKFINQIRFRNLSINRNKIKTFRFISNKEKKRKTVETKRIITNFENIEREFVASYGGETIQRRIFPFDKKLMAIEFPDTELQELFGKYNYDFSMSFMDPTIVEAKSILQDVLQAMKSIDDYLKRINFRLRTKALKDNPPSNWFSSELSLFSEDISTAPWIFAPKIYSKYKNMFFNDGESTEATENKNFSLIEPKSLNYGSLLNFKSELYNLYNYIENVFEIKIDSKSINNEFSWPKKTAMSNMVTYTAHFEKIIEPHSHRKFYSYLQDGTGDTFFRRINKNQINQRVQIENNKFFKSMKNDSDSGTFGDVNSSKASFFTPVSVRGNNKHFSLEDVRNVDLIEFNKFYDNIKIRKVRSKKSVFRITPLAFEMFPHLFETQNEEDYYVDAEDYLGSDSNFLNFSDVEVEQKKKKFRQKTKRKFSNKISKNKTSSRDKISIYKKNNIFTKRPISRAPKSSRGVPLIPNQFRAFNFKSLKIAKPVFTQREVIEADNDLLVSVYYFYISQFEYLLDFKVSSNGVKDLKNPIWNVVTHDMIDSLSNGTLCRMVRPKSMATNYEIDERVVLPYSDEHFIMTNSTLPAIAPEATTSSSSQTINNFTTTANVDMAGSVSELIKQNPTTEEQIFSSTETKETGQTAAATNYNTGTGGY